MVGEVVCFWSSLIENKHLDTPEGIPRAACDLETDATTRMLEGKWKRRDGWPDATGTVLSCSDADAGATGFDFGDGSCSLG